MTSNEQKQLHNENTCVDDRHKNRTFQLRKEAKNHQLAENETREKNFNAIGRPMYIFLA